ncbi:MAG: TlpA family protein disulfide reductase [Nannocystaceae bacterium]|nr:TlpA family protein disulfide reductase [Nannocystaceae bacterium]
MRRHLSLALSIGIAGCAGGTASTGASQSPAAGALDISLPDTNGDIISPVAKRDDDVFILAFWATWCQPCQQELTKMSGMYDTMKDRGLEIYAISIDGPDTASQVVPWVTRESYPFPVLLDRETQALTRFNPRGDIPYYVVLDASGRVLKDHQGYMSGDMDELETFLDGVLRASD